MSEETLTKTLDASYEEALSKVPEALKSEGFGILTEIDVAATLKKKLDVDFRRYTILGACNPPFAHEALKHDLAAGVMLPCNVLVYEEDDGRAKVIVVDPETTVATMGREGLTKLAADVKAKLVRVVQAL